MIGISTDTVNVSCINPFTVTMIIVCANTTHLIIDGLIQGSTYTLLLSKLLIMEGELEKQVNQSLCCWMVKVFSIVIIIRITWFNTSRGNTIFDIFHE